MIIFSHGTGDAFTVDSYSASAGQMEYDNIPTYTATRVDPDEPEPTGEFDLRDCFDFRPCCRRYCWNFNYSFKLLTQ